MVADLQASPFSLNTPFISVFAATPGREAAQKAIRKHDIWKLLYIFAFKGVAPTTLLIKSDASLKSDIPKKSFCFTALSGSDIGVAGGIHANRGCGLRRL
jgi:hypothetical protein